MLGGEGGGVSALPGVLLIGVIANGFNRLKVQPYRQLVVKGSIIIPAVMTDRMKRGFQAGVERI